MLAFENATNRNEKQQQQNCFNQYIKIQLGNLYIKKRIKKKSFLPFIKKEKKIISHSLLYCFFIVLMKIARPAESLSLITAAF